MADRSFSPVVAVEDGVVRESFRFTTNSTSDPDGLSNRVASVTRTGVGTFDVVLKDKYPDFRAPPTVRVPHATVAYGGLIEAFDPAAGTMTIRIFSFAAAPTAVETDDVVVYVEFEARNSKLTEQFSS